MQRVTTTPRTIITSNGRGNYGGYSDLFFTYIIRFDGTAYIGYDFNDIFSQYQYQEVLTPVQNETFTFNFITNQPDGLIWLDDRKDENLKMYLAVRVGLSKDQNPDLFCQFIFGFIASFTHK